MSCKRFAGSQRADPRRTSFRGALRDYQREGLGWLQFLQRFGLGGCLADDMGLGKTIQVLALLDSRRTRAASGSEATAPVRRWWSCRARWCFIGARKRRASRRSYEFSNTSASARRKPGEHFGDYDLVITTYGTLARDALHFKNVRFDYCILDEAQAIKNAGTLSAKAARLHPCRPSIGA